MPHRRFAALALLGLNRSMASLLAMAVLVGAGGRMAEQFLPLYLLALAGGAMSIGFSMA